MISILINTIFILNFKNHLKIERFKCFSLLIHFRDFMLDNGNNQSTNRSDLDIKASLLIAVKCRHKNLRTYTNTNHTQFNRHLEESKDYGLVKENGNALEITDKGKSFLDVYESLVSLLH